MRVAEVRGKHGVTCPECGEEFVAIVFDEENGIYCAACKQPVYPMNFKDEIAMLSDHAFLIVCAVISKFYDQPTDGEAG